MEYRSFGVEDFLSDEFFLRWIHVPDGESNAFWEAWLLQNPDKQLLVEEAIRIAKSLDFSEKWTEHEKSEMWGHIREGMISPADTHHASFRISGRRVWLAAASLLFVLASIGVLVNKARMSETRTSFGEIKKITLADGSFVTLNANSRLRYSHHFLNKKEREIWIDGEAFFEVSKRVVDGKKVPFTVHANNLSIQVLGTAFNVNNRRGVVNVALEHGAIKVVDREDGANTVLLEPGEGVTRSGSHKHLRKEKVAVAEYASWKNKVIIFKQKSLKELAEMMKDLYDIDVIIDNPALEPETFTGSFPTDSSEVLFEKLEKMYPLEVTRTGDTYHLK